MSKSATRQVSKPSKRKSRKKVLSRRGSSAQESPQKLMVSISGLRGIVGESLVPEVVVKYANAFAMFTGRKKIVIGRDGRYHGAMLAEILAGTLAANGCDVMDIGICPAELR